MLRILGAWACLALAAGVAGCAESRYEVHSRTAEYRPRPSPASFERNYSGYVDKRLDASTWEVTAHGTDHTEPARVSLIAHVRAAEIGKINDFKYFKITSKEDKMNCSGYSVGSGARYMSGSSFTAVTAHYLREQAPDYQSVDSFLSENMDRVKPSAVDKEKEERTHDLLVAMCRSRQR